MKVLVLGGTRFLGPFVVNELLRRKDEVAVVSRRACAWFDAEVPCFTPVDGGQATLARAVEEWRPEGVVDLLHGTEAQARAVVEACEGVEHSVHVSCTSVYGPAPICPVDEQTDLVRPEAARPEVREQMAADQVVLEAAAAGKLPATVIRLAQLYGPRDPSCPEWFFIKRVLDNRPQVAIPDHGLAIRHRGFVQNMAWGLVQALTTKRAIGEVYNLGDEKVYTLLQLVRAIAACWGTSGRPTPCPGSIGPLRTTAPSSSICARRARSCVMPTGWCRAMGSS